MKINNTQNNYIPPAFKARFFYSDSLKQVADYAAAKNKFDKLNTARKNIASSHFNVRLLLDIQQTKDGKPILQFSRFLKRKNVAIAQNSNDYTLSKQFSIASSDNCNPLDFALKTIIRMGNKAPENKLFRKAVIEK